jgi:APA family basic amino acid/polyamine antiporter
MKTGHFTRAMGLLDSTAMVVGSMIGSGIFIVSADVSRHLGSPGWLLLSWIAAGVMTVMAAVCYGELAGMFPEAGGQYIFLREAYGKLAGFLYGWTLFAVIQCGTIAAVAVAFAKFLGVFVPVISMNTILLQVGGWKFTALQLVALVIISIVTALNTRGIKTGSMVQTVFTTAKTGALALLIILGFLCFQKFNGLQPNLQNFWQPQDLKGNLLGGTELLGLLAVAMVGPLFSCDAWNNITFAGGEVKDAERTLAKSLFLGTSIVAALYLLANVVYLMLLPLHGDPQGVDVVHRGIQFAAEDRVGTAAAEIIFGPIGAQFMAVAIMISTFGAINGCILAGPRAYYAMANDGLFFKKAGELSPTTNVPVYGLLMQGVWSAILTTTGTYSNLLDYVVFAALLFYVLTVFALFILRRKMPDRERPVKVFGYPYMPALYLVTAIAIMVGQIWLSPQYTGAGLLIIISGLPAYAIWSHKNKTRQTNDAA